MKTILWILPPLAALALSACSGGAGGNGDAMNPPPPPVNSNMAPAIAGLASSSEVLQNGSSDLIDFKVSDAESDAGQLAVSVQSSNPGLMPAAGIELGGNGGTRTVLFTPEPDRSGTARITISVRDPEGLTTAKTLELSVTTQEDSFRQFAIAAIAASPEAQPAEVAGHTWVDTGEEDPAAFDTVLSPIAE